MTADTIGTLYDQWNRLNELTDLSESALDDLSEFAETKVIIYNNDLILNNDNVFCQTTTVKHLAWLVYECLNGVTECNADKGHVSNLQLANPCIEFNKIRALRISYV